MESSEQTIGDLIAEISHQLPHAIGPVLKFSQRCGSTVFLSLHAAGPERLTEARCLKDYQISEGSMVYVLCSHVPEDPYD